MRHVERVAAAGIVHVVAAVVLHQTIVGSIVDAAETQRRAQLIAFAGVVVDDIQDDFDPFAVQRADHAFEFGHLLARRCRSWHSAHRGQKSRSNYSPNSWSSRGPRKCLSATNWCTGINSTAVMPSALR